MIAVETILGHPENAAVLRYLGLGEGTRRLTPGREVSGFDEGGKLFLLDWGRLVPDEAKVTLGVVNLMVVPATGLIFAFRRGRLTVGVRADFARAGLVSRDDLRVGSTLDRSVDLRPLGPAWALIDRVACDDDDEVLLAAYELACAARH